MKTIIFTLNNDFLILFNIVYDKNSKKFVVLKKFSGKITSIFN